MCDDDELRVTWHVDGAVVCRLVEVDAVAEDVVGDTHQRAGTHLITADVRRQSGRCSRVGRKHYPPSSSTAHSS